MSLEKCLEFAWEVLDYSDVPSEKFPNVMKSIKKSLVYFFERGERLDKKLTYEVASNAAIRWGTKWDVLNRAYSLDKKLNGSNDTFMIFVAAPPEESDEVDEGRIASFSKSMDFLSNRLNFRQYTYLNALIESRPGFALENFVLTPRYVKENLDEIREKLEFIMRVYPTVAEVRRIHALDIHNALKPYTIEQYKKVLTGIDCQFPLGFFKENLEVKGKLLVEYALNNVMQMPTEQIPQKIDSRFFQKQKLDSLYRRGMFKTQHDAVELVFPGMFQPWEFSQVPNGYWDGKAGMENAREATRWLIETKLKLDLDDVPVTIQSEHFFNNGFSRMLTHCYGNSPSAAIIDAYSDRFKPWEFHRTPRGYWDGKAGMEHAREATKWLIETKLKLDLDEIPARVRKKDFRNNGLRKMLKDCYQHHYQEAIRDAYPEENIDEIYRQSEFHQTIENLKTKFNNSHKQE